MSKKTKLLPTEQQFNEFSLPGEAFRLVIRLFGRGIGLVARHVCCGIWAVAYDWFSDIGYDEIYTQLYQSRVYYPVRKVLQNCDVSIPLTDLVTNCTKYFSGNSLILILFESPKVFYFLF